MMSILTVLLIILKWIGIILGIVLLILLCVLGVILFVPVKYAIHVFSNENINMDITITWFLKLAYYHYTIKNSKKQTKIFRLFGKTLIREEEVKKNSHNVANSSNSDKKSVPKTDSNRNISKNVDEHKKSTQTGNVTQEVPKPTFTKKQKKSATVEYHKETSNEIKHIKKATKRAEEDLLDEFEEQVEEKDSFGINDILNYPYKKELISYTYEFIKKILLHIMPHSFYSQVEFGLEDPSHTGYVLAGVGIMQPYFGNSVHIKGNFNQKIFIGEVRGKGRFAIGIIIKFIIQFLLKKPIRQIVRLYFRKRKEDNNGIEFEE